MKHILCKLGFHKIDRYKYIRVHYRNGKHKWHKNYVICQRCGKRMWRFGIKKERDRK